MRIFATSLATAMAASLMVAGAAHAAPKSRAWTLHKAVDNPDLIAHPASGRARHRPWTLHKGVDNPDVIPSARSPAITLRCAAPGGRLIRC